jgi:uncharacterized protein
MMSEFWDYSGLEEKCISFLKKRLNEADTAHDFAHTKRVVANAKKLLKTEQADPETVLAAAWLHDCVTLPKNHPERKKASSLAAESAVQFLREIHFPDEKLEETAHAIEAHSFSAGIKPRTMEAKIVQDADRLDALGAIGIARCFAVSGELNRPIYNTDDPFCETREPDDTIWTIDHFYAKLFKLPDFMNTESARAEAEKRAKFMQRYLNQLRNEIISTD